jgi:hypothetical protein
MDKTPREPSATHDGAREACLPMIFLCCTDITSPTSRARTRQPVRLPASTRREPRRR